MVDTAPDASWATAVKFILPALVGAVAVISGQVLANMFSNRRHKDLVDLQLFSNRVIFLAPIADRRLAAFENIINVIDEALEQKFLTLDQYKSMKPHVFYLELELRRDVMESLARLLRATRENDDEQLTKAIENVEAVQRRVEDAFGVSFVNESVKMIGE